MKYKCEYYPNCDICKNNKHCILKKTLPAGYIQLKQNIIFELNKLKKLQQIRNKNNQIIQEIHDTRRIIQELRFAENEMLKKNMI